MSTLNYWLGKLQRLQLFGHGVKCFVVVRNGETHYKVQDVLEKDGTVYLLIED